MPELTMEDWEQLAKLALDQGLDELASKCWAKVEEHKRRKHHPGGIVLL